MNQTTDNATQSRSKLGPAAEDFEVLPVIRVPQNLDSTQVAYPLDLSDKTVTANVVIRGRDDVSDHVLASVMSRQHGSAPAPSVVSVPFSAFDHVPVVGEDFLLHASSGRSVALSPTHSQEPQSLHDALAAKPYSIEHVNRTLQELGTSIPWSFRDESRSEIQQVTKQASLETYADAAGEPLQLSAAGRLSDTTMKVYLQTLAQSIREAPMWETSVAPLSANTPEKNDRFAAVLEQVTEFYETRIHSKEKSFESEIDHAPTLSTESPILADNEHVRYLPVVELKDLSNVVNLKDHTQVIQEPIVIIGREFAGRNIIGQSEKLLPSGEAPPPYLIPMEAFDVLPRVNDRLTLIGGFSAYKVLSDEQAQQPDAFRKTIDSLEFSPWDMERHLARIAESPPSGMSQDIGEVYRLTALQASNAFSFRPAPPSTDDLVLTNDEMARMLGSMSKRAMLESQSGIVNAEEHSALVRDSLVLSQAQATYKARDLEATITETLPVYQVQANEKAIDVYDMSPGNLLPATTIGRSEDGSNILARNGAFVMEIPAKAFDKTPELNSDIFYDTSSGKAAQISPQRETSIER